MSIVLDAVRGNQELKVNNPYIVTHTHMTWEIQHLSHKAFSLDTGLY